MIIKNIAGRDIKLGDIILYCFATPGMEDKYKSPWNRSEVTEELLSRVNKERAYLFFDIEREDTNQWGPVIP